MNALPRNQIALGANVFDEVLGLRNTPCRGQVFRRSACWVADRAPAGARLWQRSRGRDWATRRANWFATAECAEGSHVVIFIGGFRREREHSLILGNLGSCYPFANFGELAHQ